MLRQAHGVHWVKKLFALRPGATLSHLVHYIFLLMNNDHRDQEDRTTSECII
jgi:hypothetical protein